MSTIYPVTNAPHLPGVAQIPPQSGAKVKVDCCFFDTQPINLRSALLQWNAALAELPPQYGYRFLHSDAMTDTIKYVNGYILFIEEVRLCSQPLGESLAALTHILINLKHTEREVFFDRCFINVNVGIRCWDHLTVKHVKQRTSLGMSSHTCSRVFPPQPTAFIFLRTSHCF